MNALELGDVSFSYPATDTEPSPAPVLEHVSLAVPEGAFALLTGSTGSGKSTLLRLAKPEVSPTGTLVGHVLAFGKEVCEFSPVESAQTVGLVFQSPDSQIVCDTVWHEMAFGLENLGTPVPEMRRRVAETCMFFGMEPWFRRQTASLSGGQRQMLALAATLAMRPRLLLLDEPTSMLDPVAEKDFLAMLFRANRELGVTVVVATHAPEPMRDVATCAFRVEQGRVRELSLNEAIAACAFRPEAVKRATGKPAVSHSKPALSLRDTWFRYERNSDWVLRGLDLAAPEGEVTAIVGGNGSGKTTLLQLACGVLAPQRGRLSRPHAASQAYLPQSPRAILSAQTVREELMLWSKGAGYGEAQVTAMMERLGLTGVAARNPLDLSGGQQQLVAFAKLLLTQPDLLILDEPTKGLDAAARAKLACLVQELRQEGRSVLLATHDLAFVSAVADSVSLLFDGAVTCTERPDEFLAGSWLYHA
ncbi:ABC transporter ATP-binding protein [Tractidigestivibacter scatoligenes]|jgi:energy-coupling factor transporter ATP-binding protein EcfA2|uniref:ABC transporter ATP-binding protein n=1 Tax=Tractidigestivibacter scatoligenes TaxID=1299998 RepID=UPI002F3595C7